MCSMLFDNVQTRCLIQTNVIIDSNKLFVISKKSIYFKLIKKRPVMKVKYGFIAVFISTMFKGKILHLFT